MDDLEQVEEELISFTSLEELQQSNFSPISQLYSVVPEVPRAEDPRLWDEEPVATPEQLSSAASRLPSEHSPIPDNVGRPLPPPPPEQEEFIPPVATIPRMPLELPPVSDVSSAPTISTVTAPLDLSHLLELKKEDETNLLF